jgi:hypothetical protein
VCKWSTELGTPYVAVVGVLLTAMGPIALRAGLRAYGVDHLNGWLAAAGDYYEVLSLINSLVDGEANAEAFARYCNEFALRQGPRFGA